MLETVETREMGWWWRGGGGGRLHFGGPQAFLGGLARKQIGRPFEIFWRRINIGERGVREEKGAHIFLQLGVIDGVKREKERIRRLQWTRGGFHISLLIPLEEERIGCSSDSHR